MQIAVVSGLAAILLFVFDQSFLGCVAVFITALGGLVGMAGRPYASPEMQLATAGAAPGAAQAQPMGRAYATPFAAGAAFAASDDSAVPAPPPSEDEAELMARLEADFGDVSSFEGFGRPEDAAPAPRTPVRQAPRAAQPQRDGALEVQESDISAGMLDSPRPSGPAGSDSPRDDAHLFERDYGMQAQDPGPAGVAYHEAFTVNEEAQSAKATSLPVMDSEAWANMPAFDESF